MSDVAEVYDPRIAKSEDCVVRHLLDRRAASAPDQVFAVFEDGTAWTHAELRNLVRATAAGLQARGVQQDDHVVCFLPNGPSNLRYWFAINYIGAVYVPVNPAYRGRLLSDVLANADAKLVIASAEFVPHLEDCDGLAGVTAIAVDGDGVRTEGEIGGVASFPASALRGVDVLPLLRPIGPWDTFGILYTSGTTGPSKGVLVSYMQLYAMFGPETMTFLGSEDRFMINMPFFHVGGTGLLLCMLIHGGSVAVIGSFSVSRFWEQIRGMGATVVFLLGVMAALVERLPAGPDDRNHPLRKVFIVPALDDVRRFGERFGVDVWSIFNMTEISSPLVTERNPSLPGTCGKVRPGVEVRLVDSNDCEVPVGDVGQIVLRSDAPWTITTGYYKRPDATAEAWRNGWFHTGDLARRDGEGNFFYVDRVKDSIRRRGENISSMEVEREILEFPPVREVAVVAVPSEIAEDEVLAVVALEEGSPFDAAELIEFLRPRMAHFMVPRYVRVVAELPKTPTAKVRKAFLRAEGLAAGTWDREVGDLIGGKDDGKGWR